MKNKEGAPEGAPERLGKVTLFEGKTQISKRLSEQVGESFQTRREFDFSVLKDSGRTMKDETDLPVDGLPTELWRVVADVQLGFLTNRDFVLSSLYAAAATLLGKRVSWTWRNHTNHATLWIANVANSGTVGKSAPQAFFFDPIQGLDTDSYTAYKAAMIEWEAKDKESKCDKPVYHCRLIDNATDEAVLSALASNETLCWNVDELDTVFSGWGQYKKSGGNIVANLLSIFDYRAFKILRVHSEPVRVKRPALSIIGGIQPETLARAMGGKGYVSNGLMQRFLYVYPEIGDIPPLPENVTPLDDARNMWLDYVSGLKDVSCEFHSTHDADEYLRQKANQWRDLCNNEYKSFPAMQSLVNKMAVHCCRWAIITAALHHADTITGDMMEYSTRCMDYFILCGEKAYCLIQNGGRDYSKRMTNKEIIRLLGERYPKLNRSKLADALGKSQPYVSGAINARKNPANDDEPQADNEEPESN